MATLNWCNSFLAVLSSKGYVCEKITREMNDYDTRMQLLPTLSQAVMMTKRYVRCKVLLTFDGCTTWHAIEKSCQDLLLSASKIRSPPTNVQIVGWMLVTLVFKLWKPPSCIYYLRVKECGILLEELNHAQFEAKDMQGRAWYFCCVLKFMLQSGK